MKTLETIQTIRETADMTDELHTVLDTIEASYKSELRDQAIQAAYARNDVEEAARLLNGGNMPV